MFALVATVGGDDGGSALVVVAGVVLIVARWFLADAKVNVEVRCFHSFSDPIVA